MGSLEGNLASSGETKEVPLVLGGGERGRGKWGLAGGSGQCPGLTLTSLSTDPGPFGNVTISTHSTSLKFPLWTGVGRGGRVLSHFLVLGADGESLGAPSLQQGLHPDGRGAGEGRVAGTGAETFSGGCVPGRSHRVMSVR